MTFIRKIDKNGRTYYYKYRSERDGDKVRSIYVGKPSKDEVRAFLEGKNSKRKKK